MPNIGREKLENLLEHYLRTVWRKAELRWDEDNSTEVGIMLDGLEEMIEQAIERHCENRPHIHADGSTH